MTSGASEPVREEVLDAFAVEPVHDRHTLERYLRDYPQFASELVELSREVSRVIEHDESPLTARDEALIEDAWHKYSPLEMKSAKDPLADLSVPDLREVAQTLGVPRQVVTAFRERRVKLDTVPRSFLAIFAHALNCPMDALASTLSSPPVSALARSYKAEVKPSAGSTVSFEQLLIDAGVSEARRAELLDEGA